MFQDTLLRLNEGIFPYRGRGDRVELAPEASWHSACHSVTVCRKFLISRGCVILESTVSPPQLGSFLSSASEVINEFLFSPLKSKFRGFRETRSRSEFATPPTDVALSAVLYLDRESSFCDISRSIAGVSVRFTMLSERSRRVRYSP